MSHDDPVGSTSLRRFRLVLDVHRPVPEVFAFVQRPENVPSYSALVVKAWRTSVGPITQGSTAVLVCRILGRRFEMGGRVSAYAANRRLVLATTSGPCHVLADLTFEPIEGGTRVTSVLRGQSRGFFKLAEPLVLRIARRHLSVAARTLKDILESRDETERPREGDVNAR